MLFLQGVSQFPQGFLMVFCGQFVVDKCIFAVLRRTFSGAEKFATF
jgi:hypothetical protein